MHNVKKVKRAQQGAVLASILPDKSVVDAAPITPKLDAYGALKVYSQYTQLRANPAKSQDTENNYRQSVEQAFQKYNGKQITDYFNDPQKQNVQQLQAQGDHTHFCISGTCRVLQDAGDKFNGTGNVGGIYFGNQTAQQDLAGDGFIKGSDPNSFKRGDILQILSNQKNLNVPDHAMAFDSYIKDPTGKVVGMRAFENHGDGVQRFADIVDDAKYQMKGDQLANATYSQLINNYNPTNPLPAQQNGLQAWTKDPSAFTKQAQVLQQANQIQLDKLRQQLIQFDPRFTDDNYARKTMSDYNYNLPKPQQLKLYAEGGYIEDQDSTIVEVNGRRYKCKLALTEEDRAQGLQRVQNLPDNEGMLFVFDEPSTVSFWMKDTLIPLDIIFIDDTCEVRAVHQGQPQNDTEIFEADDINYVLEVSLGSGIKEGDDVDIEDLPEEMDVDDEQEDNENPVMHVLDSNGATQMKLQGGERIFSRQNTKTLLRLAKRAYKSKEEGDYKRLGRKVFQYLEVQNHKEDDFVQLPESE